MSDDQPTSLQLDADALSIPSMTGLQVAVIGTGVIGLSVAVCAGMAGASVDIFSSKTTLYCSSAACALWLPTWTAQPDKCELLTGVDVIRPVLESSWKIFSSLAAKGTSGIRLITNWEYLETGSSSPPNWLVTLLGGMHPSDLPTPIQFEGRTFDRLWKSKTFVIDMSIYLPLLKRTADTRIRNQFDHTFESPDAISSLAQQYDFVFNCSGLGSRILASDESLHGVRGQLSLLQVQSSSIEPLAVCLDDVCLIGRINDWGLGSIYDTKSNEPIYQVSDEKRLISLLPKLLSFLPAQDSISTDNFTITSRIAGVRPCRDAGPRIELDGHILNLVHNYGHGGSGVSLSWGAAVAAIRLSSLSKDLK